MDEIELSKQQARGQAAKELLQNELLQEAFAILKKEYLGAWENTALTDTNARERLWQAHRLVGLLQKHLKIVFDRGKLATKELAQAKYLKR